MYGTHGYEFTLLNIRMIAVCDSEVVLITYMYGTVEGYYENTFTDGVLSEVSHSVMYEYADDTLRQKTIRSESEDMPETRWYLAAFVPSETAFDETYPELDLLISIHGRDYCFTRIVGAWRAASAYGCKWAHELNNLTTGQYAGRGFILRPAFLRCLLENLVLLRRLWSAFSLRQVDVTGSACYTISGFAKKAENKSCGNPAGQEHR